MANVRSDMSEPRRSLDQLLSLSGRTVVVTGGASGIGEAICHRVAEAGANLAIADLALSDAKALSLDVKGRWGSSVSTHQVDMLDDKDVADMAAVVDAEMDGIDAWVNAVGAYPSLETLEMSASRWDRAVALNLTTAFVGAREAARHMIRRGRVGVIVNISSTAAFRAPRPLSLVYYTAAKHGITGLGKALAVELGPFGIRVLTVAPGLVDTPGVRANRDPDAVEAQFEEFRRSIPLRRVATPDDVAMAVLFCLSDLSGFMTGSTVLVDGGDVASSG